MTQGVDSEFHKPGQGRQAPVRYGRYRLGKVVSNRPALEQKTEKAPQCSGEQFGTTGAIASRLPDHKVGDVLGA